MPSNPARASGAEARPGADDWFAGRSQLNIVLSVVAFLAELCLLVALGWVGWSLGTGLAASIGLMLLLPLAAAAVWGRWCAPRSAHRLRTPERWALKVTLFALTFYLLIANLGGPGGAFGLAMWFLFVISLPADRSPA